MWDVRAFILALLIAGCNEGGLPGGDDLSTSPRDMALTPIDLIGADLVDPCFVPASNSTISGLPYGAIGNTDVGGEAKCGGDPEGVVIVLRNDPKLSEGFGGTRVQVLLPLTLGAQSATLFQGSTSSTITVEVTAFTLRGAGPGIETLSANLLMGHVDALRCPLLDLVCI
jgi:hypothetical protein